MTIKLIDYATGREIYIEGVMEIDHSKKEGVAITKFDQAKGKVVEKFVGNYTVRVLSL